MRLPLCTTSTLPRPTNTGPQPATAIEVEDVYAQSVLAAPAMVTAVPPQVTAAEALALVRGGLVALSTLRAGRFEWLVSDLYPGNGMRA